MFRTSRQFLFIAYPVSFVFILISILAPELSVTLAPWLVILSVFLIGIPHGAIDHIIAAEIFDMRLKLKHQLLFYGSYLFLMFILGAVWIFFPIAGMIIFLLISVYHFGQADMEDFLVESKPFHWFWYNLRGAFIMVLIIFSEISITYPILEQAMNLSDGTLQSVISNPTFALGLFTGFYFAFMFSGIALGHFSNWKLFFIDNLALMALFYFSGPLIGFAIYFAVWHSAGHIFEMREYFNSKSKSLSILSFYKLSMPFTLISVVGLLILVYAQNAFGVQDMFLTLMFILISVLTLPHMLIVHKMYSDYQS